MHSYGTHGHDLVKEKFFSPSGKASGDWNGQEQNFHT